MSSSRPNLSSAFAPSAPRGAKLEGLLTPKRKKTENPPTEPTALSKPLRIIDGSEVTESSRASQEQGQLNGMERTGERGMENPPVLRDESSLVTPKNNAKKQTKTESKTSKTVPGALRNVGVYLAPQLLADVKEAVHQNRTTYADLLLDAFEALDEETLSREFNPESVPTSSGMPRRAVRRRGTAGIQIQVRLDDDQISWLDDKVVVFRAPSRSALVSAAYKLHLNRQ
ncbi:hypothetical protein [Arthrobacter sp. NyZ413]|uniref:hypothetical protein n=1 Tax=Arthrobacter sp. NyZ413 TaxID=3144669 RepID=UPI003BF78F77